MGTRAMDRHSILDRDSASPAVEEDMLNTSASRSAAASVSAGIAAANALLPKSSERWPRFPGEDGGRSLAEMAHSDLDAALQLLAERARYITGASGAAIALRRSEHNDMLCRASAGSDAPELGALLSIDYGLSGESVRTGQALRCDDAERDSRVNREVCRELGIASVVVMPIVSGERVLGVFELFSGKPRAFDDRDLSALQRLSEMAETAVKHAVAMQTVPAVEPASAEPQPSLDAIAAVTARVESSGTVAGLDFAPASPVKDGSPQEVETTELERTRSEAAPKKPLLWSATMHTQGSAGRANEDAEPMAVPSVLRNLQKCQACGFPVSQGRTLCVECEEMQWRGQRLPQQPATGAGQQAHRHPQQEPQVVRATGDASEMYVWKDSSSALTSVLTSALASVQTFVQTPAPSSSNVPDEPAGVPQDVPQDVPGDVPASDSSAPFLSSAVQSESWFAANKYILSALLVVAIVIGAIAWLR
jgi:hypothetical protein